MRCEERHSSEASACTQPPHHMRIGSRYSATCAWRMRCSSKTPWSATIQACTDRSYLRMLLEQQVHLILVHARHSPKCLPPRKWIVTWLCETSQRIRIKPGFQLSPAVRMNSPPPLRMQHVPSPSPHRDAESRSRPANTLQTVQRRWRCRGPYTDASSDVRSPLPLRAWPGPTCVPHRGFGMLSGLRATPPQPAPSAATSEI